MVPAADASQTSLGHAAAADGHEAWPGPQMNSIPAEKHFIAHVEELTREIDAANELDERLQTSRQELLMEGYSRALELEGRRRQWRVRRRELADLPAPNADQLRELASLARSEAQLGRRERRLRATLARLRESGRDPPSQPITR